MERGSVVLGILIGLGLGAIGLAIIGSRSSSYENAEEWEIVRDYEGRTRAVRVHRRAEEEPGIRWG